MDFGMDPMALKSGKMAINWDHAQANSKPFLAAATAVDWVVLLPDKGYLLGYVRVVEGISK